MRIGVDLDGVVYDFVNAFRHYLVDCRGYSILDLPYEVQWEMWETWPMDRAEFFTQFKEGVESEYIWVKGDPMAGAKEGLEALRAAGHTIHIVTHRNGFPIGPESTGWWLKEHGIPFDTLTFAADKTTVPVDIFIEDNVDNYNAIEATGTTAVLYCQPWNEYAVDAARVISWKDFVAMVSDMQDERDQHPLVSMGAGWKRHPNSQRFHDLLGEMGELHDRKQADYGRDDDPFANVRASVEWGVPGWVGALIRATDKVRRLQTFSTRGSLANEGVVDSFMDLAVYSIIARVLFEQEAAKV